MDSETTIKIGDTFLWHCDDYESREHIKDVALVVTEASGPELLHIRYPEQHEYPSWVSSWARRERRCETDYRGVFPVSGILELLATGVMTRIETIHSDEPLPQGELEYYGQR